MQEEDVIQNELNQNFNADLIELAEAKEWFGGEFTFKKMNFLERFIVKKVVKVTTDRSNILQDHIHRLADVMNARSIQL
ncbi:hypothetical protein D3C78_1735200 [compost metagenome]